MISIQLSIRIRVSYYTEKGGIHAAGAYIEPLDYVFSFWGKDAVNGEFEGKYRINLIAQFLELMYDN